ncbi:MAG: serine/threonine-protein kinase [Holophagaceae bacterium]|nr:serine/threonine-protein kinase [Holophagaceae bacterium]
MTLAPGTKLGPYEILSPLGAGGMGEVYKARDPKLDRQVAIKVLPEHLAKDADALARFEREAKALAALQHPNVLGIFDFLTEGGVAFAVMELLDGETLRALLAGGPLPPRRALDIAIQVAHGLAAAHGKGIVHRDLKPENVIVLKDGRVKILDFGLAKRVQPVDLDGPTRAIGAAQSTEKGLILGTLGYMSPEQVRGETLDARSDIFSFGSLFFELLTGQRAFARNSAADTLAAILKEEPPDLEASGRQLPASLHRLLAHCLEKDPARRFQGAQDLAFALESVTGDSGGAPATGPSGSPNRPVPMLRAGVLALIAAAVVLAAWLGRRGAPPGAPAPPLRFELVAPEGTRFGWAPQQNPFALSPDGSRIAFVVMGSDGHRSLWVRPLAELAATPLPGTEGAAAPFWSPDSRSIAFFTNKKLKKIDTSGGQPVTLCEVPDPYPSGSWGTRHEIIFAGLAASGITLVPESGGTPRSVLKPDAARQGISVGWPSFLPDGRHFLYLERIQTERQPNVRVGSTTDSQNAALLSNCSHATYVPGNSRPGSGHILMNREGSLMAQPFDAEGLRLTGEAIPVGQEIFQHAFIGSAFFSASDTGILASRDNRGLNRLAWFDRSGTQKGALPVTGKFHTLRLSPDALKVVANRKDPRTGISSIWVGDLARGVLTQLELEPEDYQPSVWSPDGARIAFSIGSMRHPPTLHALALNGANTPEPLPAPGGVQFAEDWSPDGRVLLYFSAFSESGPGLWALDIKGDRPPRKVLTVPDAINVTGAQFSPDGRWIAYCGTELGRREIYLTSFPVPGERIRITVSGGTHPRWRRDGRELYFVSTDNELIATSIQLGPKVQVGTAKPLFRMSATGWQDYDVTPDGERFLIVENLPGQGADAIVVTANWTARLDADTPDGPGSRSAAGPVAGTAPNTSVMRSRRSLITWSRSSAASSNFIWPARSRIFFSRAATPFSKPLSSR